MPWPTPQDYNEAIQNPRLCFADPELRDGVPEVTPLGLPRPVTGNFASVYRVRCGSRDWAVRCFWRETADLGQRYEAISRHLASQRLPYTVGFDYLPQGICVRGAWFPILKMEWVEGELLSTYVERHLGDASALADLIGAWLSMASALERCSVAHGDLQHGNVLVVGQQLKLVDYDCMYVPALAGRSSHELGHQNYQHPARTERHFGPYLDRFSAWVVYLALLAMRADPGLWSAIGGGDECLLLRRTDFEQPNRSALLTSLQGHADREVRAAAEQLLVALAAAPDAIPPLYPVPSELTVRGGSELAGPLPRPLIALWTLLVPCPRRSRPEAQQQAASLPAWIRESEIFAQRLEPTFSHSQMRCRNVCLALSSVAAILWIWLTLAYRLPAWSSAGLALPLVAVLDFGVLLLLFRHEPAVVEMRDVLARERNCLRVLRRLQRDRGRLAKIEERARVGSERRVAAIERRQEQLKQREDRSRETMAKIVREAGVLAQERSAALDEQERQERVQALDLFQQEYVRAYLQSRRVWSAPIAECNRMVKAGLWLSGVRTALEVEPGHEAALRRWGERRAAAVVSWRSRVQAEAKRSTPRTLPPAIGDPIVERYATRRLAIQRKQERLQAREHKVAAALAEVHAQARDRLQGRASMAASEVEALCREIDRRATEIGRQEATVRERLIEVQRELETYHAVTFAAYLRRILLPSYHCPEERLPES